MTNPNLYLDQARANWELTKLNGFTEQDIPELVKMIELLFMLAYARTESNNGNTTPATVS